MCTHHAQWKHTMASVMCPGVVQIFGILMLFCAGLPKHLSSFACFFLGNPMMGPDTKKINTPAQDLLMLNMGKYFKMPCMMWPGVTLGLHSEIIIIEQLYILASTYYYNITNTIGHYHLDNTYNIIYI